MTMPGLGAIAGVHGAGVSFWRSLYAKGRLKTSSLPRPVISVGNITLGGTGKTPFVASLARLLSEEGYLCCILSRGYGGVRAEDPVIVSSYDRILHGASESGDEPYLLARLLPGVPVVVGCDKHAAGLLALERLKAHVFLLDDGFQSWRLKRDIDIVLIDATDPWGGRALLPAGRLREPLDGLKRAHLIGITRSHLVDADRLARLRDELTSLVPNPQIFFTRSVAAGLRKLPRGSESLDAVRGRDVLAFAGVGNPDAYFRDLELAGARIVERKAFPDHHRYTSAELAALIDDAQSAGAVAIVTTEKDAVRLPPLPRDAPVPVYALHQQVQPDGADTLLRWLVSRLGQAERAQR